jgi:hypothetical protein
MINYGFMQCFAYFCQIDSSIILLMDDSILSKYLPLLGDRIAVRQFCRSNHSAAKAPGSNSRKAVLLQQLKDKLKRQQCHKDAEESSDDEINIKQKTKLRKLTPVPRYNVVSGSSKNAQKDSRLISVSWKNVSAAGHLYQVRSSQGGGSRNIRVAKKATKAQVISSAKDYFFPNGCSRIGKESDFKFELLDAQHDIVDEKMTMEEIYELVKPTGPLRFHIVTSSIHPDETKVNMQ